MSTHKILIAYYSRAGNNYVNGRVANLRAGNTAVIAEMVQRHTGGELFRIDTVKAYPADYDQTTKVAAQELRAHARPELLGRADNMAGYDVVFLGYPNWWGTMPMAVFSFLEAYDFTGKTIIPFCTHEGSGRGRSQADIRKACPSARVLDGIAIRGGTVHSAEPEIAELVAGVDRALSSP